MKAFYISLPRKIILMTLTVCFSSFSFSEDWSKSEKKEMFKLFSVKEIKRTQLDQRWSVQRYNIRINKNTAKVPLTICYSHETLDSICQALGHRFGFVGATNRLGEPDSVVTHYTGLLATKDVSARKNGFFQCADVHSDNLEVYSSTNSMVLNSPLACESTRVFY